MEHVLGFGVEFESQSQTNGDNHHDKVFDEGVVVL